MKNSHSWNLFWEKTTQRRVIYYVIYELTSFIIPMTTQLSALIFGYIRHKKINKVERPKYISYFDPVVEYYMVSYREVIEKEASLMSKS